MTITLCKIAAVAAWVLPLTINAAPVHPNGARSLSDNDPALDGRADGSTTRFEDQSLGLIHQSGSCPNPDDPNCHGFKALDRRAAQTTPVNGRTSPAGPTAPWYKGTLMGKLDRRDDTPDRSAPSRQCRDPTHPACQGGRLLDRRDDTSTPTPTPGNGSTGPCPDPTSSDCDGHGVEGGELGRRVVSSVIKTCPYPDPQPGCKEKPPVSDEGDLPRRDEADGITTCPYPNPLPGCKERREIAVADEKMERRESSEITTQSGLNSQAGRQETHAVAKKVRRGGIRVDAIDRGRLAPGKSNLVATCPDPDPLSGCKMRRDVAEAAEKIERRGESPEITTCPYPNPLPGCKMRRDVAAEAEELRRLERRESRGTYRVGCEEGCEMRKEVLRRSPWLLTEELLAMTGRSRWRRNAQISGGCAKPEDPDCIHLRRRNEAGVGTGAGGGGGNNDGNENGDRNNGGTGVTPEHH